MYELSCTASESIYFYYHFVILRQDHTYCIEINITEKKTTWSYRCVLATLLVLIKIEKNSKSNKWTKKNAIQYNFFE